MAFIREKKLRGVTYYAIVENQRDGGKVRQKVIASLGRSADPSEAIARYRELAKLYGTLPSIDSIERFKQRWIRKRTRRYRKQQRAVMMYDGGLGRRSSITHVRVLCEREEERGRARLEERGASQAVQGGRVSPHCRDDRKVRQWSVVPQLCNTLDKCATT